MAMSDAERDLYWKQRSQGRPALQAWKNATTPRLAYHKGSDGVLVLDLAEDMTRDGWQVTITREVDDDPELSILGEFTDTWVEGALIANRPDTKLCRYFVPSQSIRSHRADLSKLGYARHAAQCLAVKYARQDMKAARDPDMYVIAAQVTKHGVRLGSDGVGNTRFDAAKDLDEQTAEVAQAYGLVDEVLSQARATLDQLTGAAPLDEPPAVRVPARVAIGFTRTFGDLLTRRHLGETLTAGELTNLADVLRAFGNPFLADEYMTMVRNRDDD